MEEFDPEPPGEWARLVVFGRRSPPYRRPVDTHLMGTGLYGVKEQTREWR